VREYFNCHFHRGDEESLTRIQARWRKSPAPRMRAGDSATPSPSERVTSLQGGGNGRDNPQDGLTAIRTGGPSAEFRKRRRISD
jgi:hypothetical protein